MGVEYLHGFYVTDLNWLGSHETAMRVHDLLSRRGLVADPPEVFDLDGGRRRKQKGVIGALKSKPDNLLVRYGFVEGVPAIEQIMGPSRYPAGEIGPRYFQGISVLVGTDFRTLGISEMFLVEVDRPPETDGEPVPPYPFDSLKGIECGEVYPSEATTTPPVARITAERPNYAKLIPKGFAGVWRVALILDCGKDLPAFAGERNTIPNQDFTREVGAAFGTGVSQIGYFY